MANGAFTKFQPSDIINSVDSATGTCWTNNAPRLTEVYTSSVQNSQNSGHARDSQISDEILPRSPPPHTHTHFGCPAGAGG